MAPNEQCGSTWPVSWNIPLCDPAEASHPTENPPSQFGSCGMSPWSYRANRCFLPTWFYFFFPPFSIKKKTHVPASQTILELWDYAKTSCHIIRGAMCWVFFPTVILLFFYFSLSLCNRGIRLLPPPPPSHTHTPVLEGLCILISYCNVYYCCLSNVWRETFVQTSHLGIFASQERT